jgi:hypothetical protein
MEIETQDFPDCDTQATQTIYESCSEICIPPWARMTYLLHSTLIGLFNFHQNLQNKYSFKLLF